MTFKLSNKRKWTVGRAGKSVSGKGKNDVPKVGLDLFCSKNREEQVWLSKVVGLGLVFKPLEGLLSAWEN